MLRHSDWRSPQTIMLGTIECRSPDPLTVARVGRYEVWHREVRLAILSLPEFEQRAVWRYLHADSRILVAPDGKVLDLPPVLDRDSLSAFESLWYVLAERNWLHAPTLAPGRLAPDGQLQPECVEQGHDAPGDTAAST